MYVADMQETQISVQRPTVVAFSQLGSLSMSPWLREQLLGYPFGEAEESLQRRASMRMHLAEDTVPVPPTQTERRRDEETKRRSKDACMNKEATRARTRGWKLVGLFCLKHKWSK
jgi:hypothetical protein